MNKPIKIMVPVFLLALGIALLCTTGGSSVEGQSDPSTAARATIASFNSKVKAARSGDAAAVNQLAEGVFQQFGSPELGGIPDSIKDRLVLAEIIYRQTGKGGIPEPNVARAINGFAKQMNAPDYAVVNTAQVRYLRVKMMAAFPDFITQSTSKELAVNPEMSPLEAAGITMLLIYQKLSNADFQVTPREWLVSRYEQTLANWKAFRSGNPRPAERGTKCVMQVESTRTQELRQVITTAARALGPEALLTLAESSLDTLGIPRSDGRRQ